MPTTWKQRQFSEGKDDGGKKKTRLAGEHWIMVRGARDWAPLFSHHERRVWIHPPHLDLGWQGPHVASDLVIQELVWPRRGFQQGWADHTVSVILSALKGRSKFILLVLFSWQLGLNNLRSWKLKELSSVSHECVDKVCFNSFYQHEYMQSHGADLVVSVKKNKKTTCTLYPRPWQHVL